MLWCVLKLLQVRSVLQLLLLTHLPVDLCLLQSSLNLLVVSFAFPFFSVLCCYCFGFHSSAKLILSCLLLLLPHIDLKLRIAGSLTMHVMIVVLLLQLLSVMMTGALFFAKIVAIVIE